MPSRPSYWQTADGFLEKNDRDKDVSATLFQVSTVEPDENGFGMDLEECSPWLKGSETSEILLFDVDSFAAEPMDFISNNMLTDDAPFEVDDSLSMPALQDPNSGDSSSITPDLDQNCEQSPHRGHSMSLSKIQELRDIAMPYYARSSATKAEELESCYSSESETEALTKKRTLSISSERSKPGIKGQTRKQQGHNAIEKRYRSNLNDKIHALRQRLPSLRTIPEGGQADADADQCKAAIAEVGQKSGKAEVLTGAVAYISHLEGTVERLGSEITILKTRVIAFEQLVMSSSVGMSNGLSSRDLVAETLETVQAGFDYTKGEMDPLTKQSRATRYLKQKESK